MSRTWETLGLLIKHIQHRNMRLLDEKLARIGISVIQWNALRTIERYPGSCMHRLAKLTFNSDQALGTLTARLLRLGLVERKPGHGRINLHALTPKGAHLLGEGRSIVQTVLAESFSPLNETECATLQNILSKLLDDDYPPDP